MRNSILRRSQVALVWAVCLGMASNAAAQSADCYGEGEYIGDLIGSMTFGVSSDPRTAGQYFISISGVMIRGERFRGGEVGWYSSVAGITITLGELDGQGRFSTEPRVSDWGHVVTLEGEAGDCGITGTWTLDYDETHGSCSGEDCETRSGTFELHATGGTGSSGNNGGGSILCGTMSVPNAALFMVTAVGMSRMRRRRRGR